MATVRTPFATVLAEAGGAGAPSHATAGLRHALRAALEHGRAELSLPRSGYGEPVVVVVANGGGRLLAALPLPADYAADPAGWPPRSRALVARVTSALHDLADASEGVALHAGDHDGFLLLACPAPAIDAEDLDELAPLAVEERLARVDKLRAIGLAVPYAVLEDGARHLREPVGADHPLNLAARVLEQGGDPTDPAALAAAAAWSRPAGPVRPHDDADPARQAARRILQTLKGKGKWGTVHHTDVAHAARGFEGNERALALRVAKALLDEGLLAEKPSNGQRHVFLQPSRKADIDALIEKGELPPGLVLPSPRRAT